MKCAGIKIDLYAMVLACIEVKYQELIEKRFVVLEDVEPIFSLEKLEEKLVDDIVEVNFS